MEGGDSNHAIEYVGTAVKSVQTESKREYESILESGVVDSTPPRKKQVVETTNSESASELSDANTSVVVDTGTGCQIVSGSRSCVGLGGSVDNPAADASTSAGSFPGTSQSAASEKNGNSSGYYGVNGRLKIKFQRRPELEEPQYRNQDGLVASAWMGSSQSTSRALPRENMELKMSKKVSLDGRPESVKELLCTGLLDGHHICYASKQASIMLPGRIQGGNYLCGCSSCKYSQAFSAVEFERHAGGFTKHPNKHIFLENGKSVYSVMRALKKVQPNMLEQAVIGLIGLPGSRATHSKIAEPLCEWEDCSSRGSTGDSETQSSLISCEIMGFHEHILDEHSNFPYNNMQVSPKNKSCVTPRDNDLHRLLFMPNGLPDGTELAYCWKGQRLLSGYKRGNGIICSCCNHEISPSQFEAHAGCSSKRQPYRNIYTPDGASLHDLSLSMINGEHTVADDSEDICDLCGVGGKLLLCDACSRAFHTSCLGLPFVPEGSWFCTYCNCPEMLLRKGSFIEPLAGAPKRINVKLRRVVEIPIASFGDCVICREQDFGQPSSMSHTVLLCDQCEKEYHIECMRKAGICDLKGIPRGKWFCCADCNSIHATLGNLFCKNAEVIPFAASNILKMKLQLDGTAIEVENLVEWQLLSGTIKSPWQKALLSRAVTIFRECFDPIVLKSGRNLIPAMVHGRSLDGYDFRGMFCAVLTVNTVVVSAGIVRVFGKEAVELPLVATSKQNQGKGYFWSLFLCIEKLLRCGLGVESLILPTTEEVRSLWTNKFGFTKMPDERVQKYVRNNYLMIFQGTSMLEKKVPLVSHSNVDCKFCVHIECVRHFLLFLLPSLFCISS